MTKEDPLTDEILRLNDERSIANGTPILSVLVLLDDGSPCSVAVASIKKHNLALPGESLEATVARLQEKAFAYFGTKH